MTADRDCANEAELGGSQRVLQQVLEALPVGVVVTNRAGDIVLANPMSRRVWQGDTIVSGAERRERSKGVWHDTGKHIAPNEWASHRALSEGQVSLNELIDIETYAGEKKIIENSAAPIRDEAGTIVGAVIVNQDVTQRVSAEDELRKIERLLRDAEELGQTGSWEHNLITGEIVNSPENTRLFFGADRSRGARFEDYGPAVHPDDRDYVLKRHEQLLAEGGPSDIQYRVVWPDGTLHWLFGRAMIDRNESGKPVRVYGTNLDITERVRTEAALRESTDRLRRVSRRVLDVQEEERRHLSRELHDEFGQLLATITVLVHAAKAVAGEAAQPRLDECVALLQRAGAEVRSLALELRPVMLDSAGLDATLRWLAEQHEQRTAIPIEVRGHVGAVAGNIAIVLFRVAQEALTNALRHAHAEHVWIELTQSDAAVELVIRDDGDGFDVDATLMRATRGSRLGLLGMRERVQLVGGTLDVDSAPGRGTRIRLSLPVSAAVADAAEVRD